jgi:hypothetical protein
MPSGVFDSILLKHLWGTEALRAVFNDENRVQKWFDFQAALALAQAELGIIPQAAADEIARKAKVRLSVSVKRQPFAASEGPGRSECDQQPVGLGVDFYVPEILLRIERLSLLKPSGALH